MKFSFKKSFSNLSLSPTLASNELVSAKRARGEKVFHLGFGQSPFPVPARLKQALSEASGRNEYLPTCGLPELCAAAKSYYAKKLSLKEEEYDCLVAPGSKLILYSVQMAVEGDLLMPVPSWVSYAPQARMLNSDVIFVPTKLDDYGYHINCTELRETIYRSRKEGKNPTKIILNYPNNPTGLTIPNRELEAIANVCIEENILILSDEIYGLTDYNFQYRSISTFAPQNTVISTGLSKHLSLGGWRLGVGFIPKSIPRLNNVLNQIASETWSCTPAPIQKAAVEAYLGHEDIEKHISNCTSVHSLVSRWFSKKIVEIGIDCPQAQGAFYVYPNFEKFRPQLNKKGIKTSTELSDFLLRELNIATLPGIEFGETEDKLTLRMAMCDYDGAKALEGYRNNPNIDPDLFVKTYAPNIYEVVERLSVMKQSWVFQPN
ncbi:pyridoxal phosphate-dependent aminotransferase [Bdellovibrionota bacterium]